jgi:hypothetical protein
VHGDGGGILSFHVALCRAALRTGRAAPNVRSEDPPAVLSLRVITTLAEHWVHDPCSTVSQVQALRSYAGSAASSACRSKASTTAIAVRFTISRTSAPRCRMCTGFGMPSRMGPMAVAPPMRAINL